jgi:formylglycine-generating enzyme required for sulfatase activity
MDSGGDRTEQMSLLVSRAQTLGAARDASLVAEKLFAELTDGSRIVGLALARKEPRRNHIEMAIDGIAHSRSAFEQYHALLLARSIFELIDPMAAQQLGSAIGGEIGKTILREDQSRWRQAQWLLEAVNKIAPSGATWSPDTAITVVRIEDDEVALIRCRPSASLVRYDDPEEKHGPFVVTRGAHSVVLPREFLIGQFTVTNRMFMRFIQAGAYHDDSLWPIPPGSRARFLTADGNSLGPSTWSTAECWPDGKEDHPVSGVSYLEAQAYSAWLNRVPLPDGSWSLPREDEWEFAARGESGLTYPWGDAFSGNRCNSVEAKTATTTSVRAYASGASSLGCYGMAGNVWEFVIADDMRSDWCVLRGGSFKNDRTEVRSYLRLINVPIWHRPADFGFRLCLESTTARRFS